MSWNVSQIFSFSQFLINKAQSFNYSPDNFFYAWNSEQRAYMADLVGHFQARANGKQAANTGLIENEISLTKLSPFTKPTTLTVTAGNANKPSDFIYCLAARINDNEVYFINKGQIQSVLNSVIDPPSVANNKYYATEYEGYYKVWPSTVTSMDLDYIADPVDVVYGYILDGNGRPVYDPGSSVQPAWDNLSLAEITKRTLRSLGVHYSSQDFENFGQTTIVTGN